jgi:site-specific DNA-methyltransferase (adenine-specific)
MSPRIETIGDATLYLGDCRDILPTLGDVAHVVSDPPYEDELHAAMGRIKRTDGRTMVQELGFAGVNAARPEVARLCAKIAGGWVILFTLAEGVRAWRDDIQAAGGKWDTTCFWVKPDASPRFNGQGAARGAECFVTAWCGPGHRRWNAGGKRGVYTHCVNTQRQGEHPTEKPVPLMMEIISDFTRYGELVCDPFMGSGTTGVACANLGRAFVGVEQDAKWFDLACRRIEEAYRQPRLFEEPARKPVQSTISFGDAS